MTTFLNNIKGDQLTIETKFKDTLTISSCTTLIIEVIKYILYHKQQLPYTFDRLKYVITKRRSIQEVQSKKNLGFTNEERLFRIAEEALTTLELLFEKTKQEILKNGKVNEIAILFGSSPLTPKQVYHIHLPEIYCNHQFKNHRDRIYLFQFVQSLVQSSQLSEMLMKPMAPTNMYVFLSKRVITYSEDTLSSWFIPKKRFEIPPHGQHFHIKLSGPSSHLCTCKGFTVYLDGQSDVLSSSTPLKKEENFNSSITPLPIKTEWYQACAVFKGFKDVYINSVSVSDSWIK